MNFELPGSESLRRTLAGRLAGSVLIVLVLAAFGAACTYLKPVAEDSETLQQEIRSGQAVEQGDRVRVVTRDGVSRRLHVVSVQGDALTGYLDTRPVAPVRTEVPGEEQPEKVRGPLVEIPVADIVLLEKETLSKGKTAATAGGVTLVMLALMAAAAMAAVMTP